MRELCSLNNYQLYKGPPAPQNFGHFATHPIDTPSCIFGPILKMTFCRPRIVSMKNDWKLTFVKKNNQIDRHRIVTHNYVVLCLQPDILAWPPPTHTHKHTFDMPYQIEKDNCVASEIWESVIWKRYPMTPTGCKVLTTSTHKPDAWSNPPDNLMSGPDPYQLDA